MERVEGRWGGAEDGEEGRKAVGRVSLVRLLWAGGEGWRPEGEM